MRKLTALCRRIVTIISLYCRLDCQIGRLHGCAIILKGGRWVPSLALSMFFRQR